MKKIRILFVCLGNICRSPMAEFIMKDMIKAKGLEDKYLISSAAVSDEEYGQPIYPPARRCLVSHGVYFDPSKTSRDVVPQDYELYDRLICMDSSNIRWLRRIVGDDPQSKISLMMSYAGQSRDVADPWYTRNFEQTFSDISLACKAMIEQDFPE